MAIAKTDIKRVLRNGVLEERGTYTISGGVAVAVIAPEPATADFNATIAEINTANFTSVNDVPIAKDMIVSGASPRASVQITSTVNDDSGFYHLEGRAV